MERGSRLLWLCCVLLIMTGCAPVISKNLREQADSSLTFGDVIGNPEAFKGRTVIWGGEIIETSNQENGETVLEVFQRPLNWREEPQETVASEGRFLVRVQKYLDPYVYQRGRKITVAGEILGAEVKPIGKMEYHYPLVSSKEIYLWTYYDYPYYYYPYYPPPYPYSYPWYPWGGWGWGWGWGYRYRH